MAEYGSPLPREGELETHCYTDVRMQFINRAFFFRPDAIQISYLNTCITILEHETVKLIFNLILKIKIF